MNDLYRDITIVVMMILGIGAFMSGLFIISTVVFGSAAVLSNIVMRKSVTVKPHLF